MACFHHVGWSLDGIVLMRHATRCCGIAFHSSCTRRRKAARLVFSSTRRSTARFTWARFHETLRRVVAQDTMRNASYLATRCKNDFTKLTMHSMHRKLLDNYAEHVARYDDRYSRLRMWRVNLIIRKCVQNGVDAACRSRRRHRSTRRWNLGYMYGVHIGLGKTSARVHRCISTLLCREVIIDHRRRTDIYPGAVWTYGNKIPSQIIQITSDFAMRYRGNRSLFFVRRSSTLNWGLYLHD